MHWGEIRRCEVWGPLSTVGFSGTDALVLLPPLTVTSGGRPLCRHMPPARVCTSCRPLLTLWTAPRH